MQECCTNKRAASPPKKRVSAGRVLCFRRGRALWLEVTRGQAVAGSDTAGCCCWWAAASSHPELEPRMDFPVVLFVWTGGDVTLTRCFLPASLAPMERLARPTFPVMFTLPDCPPPCDRPLVSVNLQPCVCLVKPPRTEGPLFGLFLLAAKYQFAIFSLADVAAASVWLHVVFSLGSTDFSPDAPIRCPPSLQAIKLSTAAGKVPH